MKKNDDSQKRIQIMRNGGKVECPICNVGKWSAVGDPKTTALFECDHCHKYMSLTVAKS